MKEKISKKLIHDRIEEFTKTHPNVREGLEYADSCSHLEEGVVDKATPRDGGKPSSKKAKDWIIEVRWLSEKDYKTQKAARNWWWGKSDDYTDQWTKSLFSGSFKRSQDAINSFNESRKQKWSFTDHISGREFRVRNKTTNEIINL